MIATEDKKGVAESVLDRMVLLVHRLADCAGQPTVTQFEDLQREAKCLIALSKTLKGE